ncbi:MAG: hypothetical protein ACXAC7_01665 [Candidatus Hodarchaeales archaeon]|jgi:hypothetical protein
MGLDRYLKKKKSSKENIRSESTPSKGNQQKNSDISSEYVSPEVDEPPFETKGSEIATTMTENDYNVDLSYSKRKKSLINILSQKFESKDKFELLKAIVDIVHSSPLYISHKNMITTLLKGESKSIKDLTSTEIAFELDLNELYVEVLLIEIRLDWNTK